jgi:hypothetical protein
VEDDLDEVWKYLHCSCLKKKTVGDMRGLVYMAEPLPLSNSAIRCQRTL